MIADCTAIILAGGDSRRMGNDKSSLVLDGQTLLERVNTSMSALFSVVMLSVRQPRQELEMHQILDDPAYAGPLAGLVSGLQTIDTTWAFVVACDMPFIELPVIELLAQRREKFDAVVPLVQGYPQTMAGFYARSSLNAIRDHLNSGGKNSMRAVLEKLVVCYVQESELRMVDPDMRSFVDLDTPQDLALAKKIMGKAG